MDRFKFPKQHFGEREFWYLDDVRFPANVSNDDAVGEFCGGHSVMEEVVDTQWGAGHQGRHGHDDRPVKKSSPSLSF
ncbi:hypothetical protein AMTRI_Chr10g227590 [Amborella trichopoda]